MKVNPVTSLLKTLFASYFFTILSLLLSAFIMYRLHLKAEQMETVIILLYLLSCFLGGFLMGKIMKTRRLVWGLVFGLLYFVILMGMSLLLRHALYSAATDVVKVLACCGAGGALGGVAS